MWSFSFSKAGDFLGQVRYPDFILFQISCVSENQHKREKPELESDVYGTAVKMTQDGSITPLTVTSANTITEEAESNTK